MNKLFDDFIALVNDASEKGFVIKEIYVSGKVFTELTECRKEFWGNEVNIGGPQASIKIVCKDYL